MCHTENCTADCMYCLCQPRYDGSVSTTFTQEEYRSVAAICHYYCLDFHNPVAVRELPGGGLGQHNDQSPLVCRRLGSHSQNGSNLSEREISSHFSRTCSGVRKALMLIRFVVFRTFFQPIDCLSEQIPPSPSPPVPTEDTPATCAEYWTTSSIATWQLCEGRKQNFKLLSPQRANELTMAALQNTPVTRAASKQPPASPVTPVSSIPEPLFYKALDLGRNQLHRQGNASKYARMTVRGLSRGVEGMLSGY